MHKPQLKSFCNSSQLVIAMIALLGLAGTPGSLADECPEAFYPAVIDSGLLMPAHQTAELLAAKGSIAGCPTLLADLAQLYFWGAPGVAADLDQASSHLRALRYQQPSHGVLRLLEPALVLAGKLERYSHREALRRYLREVDSGAALRRDKALAALNQLAQLRPRVHLARGSVFADPEALQPYPGAPTEAILLDAEGGELLLIDANGTPDLAWVRPLDGATPAQFALRFFAGHAAPGLPDNRRQQWRMPNEALRSGVLKSHFVNSVDETTLRCTATLVADDWLLTAAHCLFASAALREARLTELVFQWQGKDFAVEEIWHHRRHRPADQFEGAVARYSGSDLALLKLKQGPGAVSLPQLRAPARQVLEVSSFGFPNDKALNSLWASQCQARPELLGEEAPKAAGLGDVYRLDCFSAAGQSGAAVVDSRHPQRIYGVVSARIRGDGDDYVAFTALGPDTLADIRLLIQGGETEPRYFQRLMPPPAQLAQHGQ